MLSLVSKAFKLVLQKLVWEQSQALCEQRCEQQVVLETSGEGSLSVFRRTYCMLYCYSSQILEVNWRNGYLECFEVGNRVRQGSGLSPWLFNIYIEDLLEKLNKSGHGAKISDLYVYVGCLVYTDDITLVSPCMDDLQKMLDVCASLHRALQLQNCRFTRNR